MIRAVEGPPERLLTPGGPSIPAGARYLAGKSGTATRGQPASLPPVPSSSHQMLQFAWRLWGTRRAHWRGVPFGFLLVHLISPSYPIGSTSANLGRW